MRSTEPPALSAMRSQHLQSQDLCIESGATCTSQRRTDRAPPQLAGELPPRGSHLARPTVRRPGKCAQGASAACTSSAVASFHTVRSAADGDHRHGRVSTRSFHKYQPYPLLRLHPATSRASTTIRAEPGSATHITPHVCRAPPRKPRLHSSRAYCAWRELQGTLAWGWRGVAGSGGEWLALVGQNRSRWRSS